MSELPDHCRSDHLVSESKIPKPNFSFLGKLQYEIYFPTASIVFSWIELAAKPIAPNSISAPLNYALKYAKKGKSTPPRPNI